MDPYAKGIEDGIQAFQRFEDKESIKSHPEAESEARKLFKPAKGYEMEAAADYLVGFIEGFTSEWCLWEHAHIP